MSTWWQILSRKKRLNPETISSDTQLARVLTTFDLTALGVGSTLGVGVYVLAGHVAKDTAGPSVVLSFLIAAIASIFAGLCYAEFGARVPRAGSAYIYSYVCVGELIAFIIGWNLILEYVIGSASVAKGLSLYLDSLLNNTLKNTFRDIAPMNSYFMAEYFDFFSFGITLVLGAALAFGLKESTLANNIFTILNIFVVLFVIIAGSLNANPKNWTIQKQDIPANATGGEGGFFPFGIEGTIKGAATCFYGFVGFDCIATTGEEVKNPQRAIPISIISSLFIIFLSYFGISTVLTLMCPYYLQDSDAPIPHVFAIIGWDIAKWIVAIGGIFGLCASLFGAMFPLPRIIYAMASDALVFKFLGTVSSKFKTPVVGTLLAALLTGLMSAIFNLKQLVNMMSIGTLLAYTIVAACVVILRYSINEAETIEWKYTLLQPELDSNDEYTPNDLTYDEDPDEHLQLVPPAEELTMRSMAKNIFNFKTRSPTRVTQTLVTILVFLFTVLAVVVAVCVSQLQVELEKGELKAVVPIAILVLFMVIILVSIYAQPKVIAKLSFKVPLVPIIPALSIFINIYLMVMLDINTWIRFSIWMIFGIPIYLASCLLYSKQKSPTPNKSSIYGIVNPNFSFSSNNDSKNRKLTIPEIRIERPSIVQHWTAEGMLQQGSETKRLNIELDRKSSEDRAITNAVSALDKVILESEDELQEAINTESGSRHSVILERNREDSYSSDSGSESSKEMHVKAVVHQEDDTVTINEETIATLNQANISNVQSVKKERKKSRNVENLEATLSLYLDKNDNNIKLEDIEDINTLEVTGDEVAPTEETEEASKNNEDTKLKSREESPENEVLMSTKLDSETGEIFIPPPPPISDFLESQIFIPSSNTSVLLPTITRRTKYQSSNPVIVTPKSIGEVQLQPIPAKRSRSDSLSSVGSLNNIKPGSRKFEKFKTQLNTMLKKKEPLKIPDRVSGPEDLSPLPQVEKQVNFIDQMLDQNEEIKDIPQDFGKTKEFKENLNSLLLKKQNKKQEKPEYVRKYADKALPVTKEDEVNHKKRMLGTLNSIKLRKTGLKGIDVEFQDAPDDNADEGKKSGSQENSNTTTQKEEIRQSLDELFNPIQVVGLKNEENVKELDEETKVIADKERHKRYMVDTLKTLKLRKTGINLNEANTTDANPLVVT